MKIISMIKEHQPYNYGWIYTFELENGLKIQHHINDSFIRTSKNACKLEEHLIQMVEHQVKELDKIKSKVDAILYVKDSNNLIRKYAIDVLKGKIKLKGKDERKRYRFEIEGF